MKIESRTIATFLFLALVGYLAVTGRITADDAIDKVDRVIQQLPQEVSDAGSHPAPE